MLVLVVLAGLPLAPMIASRNQLVGVAAPEGAATESFTWLLTALVAGSAAGAAVTGSLAEADNWRLAVLLGCAVAAAGAIARRPGGARSSTAPSSATEGPPSVEDLAQGDGERVGVAR